MKPLPVTTYRESLFMPSISQQLMTGLVIFLAICGILYFGKDIIIPVVLAIIMSVLLAPLVKFLHSHLLPKGAAVAGVVLGAFLLAAGMTVLIGSTLTNLAGDLPQYQSNLRQKARSLHVFTSGSGTLDKAANVLEDLQAELSQSQTGAAPLTAKPIPVEIRDSTLGPLSSIIAVISAMAHPLAQFAIVFLMLAFILFNREDLRNRLIRLAGTGDINRTTVAIDETGHRLSKLFRTQLALNAVTGILLGSVLFAIGVPGALLWGILTAVLRFVPYIGTMLAAILPVAIALAVGDGWTLGLLTLGIIVCIEVAVGQVIEPIVFGKMTGLSPVAVVVAAAFWTALWGPVGLILSTPLTIGLLVLGRNIESLNFFEVLLGSDKVLTPETQFYQRMLAADAMEAAEQAHALEGEQKLERFLTEIAVPGLIAAHADQQRNVLTKEQATTVAHTFSDTLDDLWDEVPDIDGAEANTVIVPGHGALNFTAALAASALFRLRGIPHAMLGQDSLAPGKPFTLPDHATQLLICYLLAPTAAQEQYMLKRAKSRAGHAEVRSLAWKVPEGAAHMMSPRDMASLLKAAPQPVEETDVPKHLEMNTAAA
jgi:predicted PurR-regulated permease PerM